MFIASAFGQNFALHISQNASFVLDTNLNALKLEHEIHCHKVDLQTLCQEFATDVSKGKTLISVKESIEKNGLNKLSPPRTTPGINFINIL